MFFLWEWLIVILCRPWHQSNPRNKPEDKIDSLPTENNAMKAWGNYRDAAFDFTNYHLNRKSENNRTCLKPTTQKTHALWSKSRKHLPIGFKKRPQLPGPIASSTSEKKSKLSWDRWRISGGDTRLQSWSNTQTSTTLRGSSRAWRLYMVPFQCHGSCPIFWWNHAYREVWYRSKLV